MLLKKVKDIINKVLYLSKLTEINKKKLRLLLSVTITNLVVSIDVFVIIVFTSLIGDYLSFDNYIVSFFLTIFLKYKILFPILIILRYVLIFIETYNIELLSLQVNEKLKSRVMLKLYTRGNYSTADSYFYLNNVSTHISTFYRSFANLLNNLIQIAGYSFFLVSLNAFAFITVILCLITLSFPTKYLLRKAKHYQHLNFGIGMSVNQYIQRIIDNMFLIKILDTFEFESKNFKQLLADGKNAEAQNKIYGALNSIFPTFLVAFILSILMTFFGFAKYMTLEFIGILLRIFQSFGSLNNTLTMVLNSSVHLEELYKFENQRETKLSNYRSISPESNYAIEFDKVAFTYLRSNEQIFENITFNIEKNSHTVITGPNGSGKSTLLGLVSGLYVPNDGHINVSSNKLGYVGVTPLVIEGSIRENLLYGNPEEIDDFQMSELLEKFQFKNRKVSLDELVTNKTLSSGQMQKLSFIRALLNKVDILLLDESTSNLDTESKLLIFDILNKENISIVNATHNMDDFSYDHHIEIQVAENIRTFNILK